MFETAAVGAIVIAALSFGSELFVPLAIAVLLAFALSPVVRSLRRRRVPNGIAVSVTVVLAFVIIFFVGTVVTRQVTELGNELPHYRAALQDKVKELSSLSGGKGGAIDRASETLQDLQDTLEKSKTAQTGPLPTLSPGITVHPTTPIPVEVHPPPPTALEQIAAIIAVALTPLATVGIVIVFTIFLLFKQTDVRDRAIRLLGVHDLEKTTVALEDAGRRLSSYFLTLVVINAGFGAAIGAGLWAIGIPNPILWGIIAMLMRFMPMIGVPIAAAIPLVLAAAVDPGWSMLAEVLALYVIAEIIMNVAVEPMLQSTSTGLSALAILLSAAFWTLLWGPIGLLLAVPLTAVLVVLGRHVEGLNFLHVLLGDTPALTPAEGFYQRMLASDPHEAAEQAEQLLKDRTLIEYYDSVVMEGLRLAQNDASLEKLEPARLPAIRDTATGMIEALADHLPEVDEKTLAEALPEAWTAAGAITCVAGQSALDELAAIMLMQLLEQRGFHPKMMSTTDISAAHMAGSELNGTKLVVISIFDIEHRGAYLKFLVRRLRRVLPHARFLGAFWKHDDDNRRLAEIAAIVPDTVKSLSAAVYYCVEAARHELVPAAEDAASPLPEAAAAAS